MEIIETVANYGVPTIIAFYALYRIDNSIKELNNNIIELNSLIRRDFLRRSPVVYKEVMRG